MRSEVTSGKSEGLGADFVNHLTDGLALATWDCTSCTGPCSGHRTPIAELPHRARLPAPVTRMHTLTSVFPKSAPPHRSSITSMSRPALPDVHE